MSNVIGFDYGECRIGVAIGVPSAGTASPLTTLVVPSSGTPWDKIDQIIGQWHPDALVVGRVEHHTQDQGRIKQHVRNFCKALQRRYRLPVETVDESFSSARAYALLKDMRARGQRRKIRKTDIDKAAAAIILQSWFACHDGLPAERGTS
ncbi:MAG: Holliday junction resolvase RuvX [Proteobacteria bacterium]|nr:Holliday junction resolvase RuvX [Gammaproteobacteria bacterium]MYB88578.1 Holliday junction resolvase RuvX [Pseudomonadota bacterium]